jgi:uncharacterized repeat protein (TIGR01451 family)
VRRRTGLLVLIGLLLLAAWAAPAASAQNADLSVVVTGPDETTADTDIAFSITASNLGPDPADTVTLTDVVPTGATFVSLSQDGGPTFLCVTPSVGAGGAVTCSIAALATGEEAAFTLTVHVDPATPPGTFISDTVSVSTATFDPNEENNASTASTLVGPVTVADVGVRQSALEGVVPDSDLTYAITVTNGGPSAAADAAVTDTLPGATTFVSLTGPAGWSCSTPAAGGGGTVTCTNPSLPSGATESFTLVVHIPSGTATGTELLNIVTLSTSDLDPNSENDQAATSTIVASADLSVTISGPATVTAGASISYTITVANAGPDDANSVQLVDTLPAGLTFVSLIQDTGPAFVASTPGLGQGGTVGVSRSPFASGATAQFTLQVVVDPTTADETAITNTATFSSPTGDPDPVNNASSAVTPVTGLVADLAVASSGPATATTQDTLTYTITLTNDGPDTAYGVALDDAVPAHTTFASFAQQDGPTFDLASPAVGAAGTVNATRGQLASGEVAAFTLQIVVDAATADQTKITNATNAASAIHDPDPSDDSSSVTTTIAIPATSTPVATVTPAPVVPVSPTPTPGASPGDKVVVCRRVPRLKGKTYRAAKRALQRHHCNVRLLRRGSLRRANGKPTRVRSQRPKPGTTLYSGQRVRVRLR